MQTSQRIDAPLYSHRQIDHIFHVFYLRQHWQLYQVQLQLLWFRSNLDGQVLIPLFQ